MTSVWMHLAPHIKDIEHAAMRYVYGWKLSSRDLAGMKDAALREISGYMSRFDRVDRLPEVEEVISRVLAFRQLRGCEPTSYDEMLDTASAETGYRISPAARIWEEEK